MFKKKLLAAAVITGAVISGSAYAGTWTPTAGAPDFASETLGTGVTLTPTVATYLMASTPGNGSAFNIVYTLSGGAFDTALASGSTALTGAGAASITLVGGGAVGDATATFRVDVSTALTAASLFTLTYDIAGESMGSSATLGVTLTDTLGNVDTAGAATAVATSSAGTTLSGTALGAALTQIDVASGSLSFVGAAASQQIGTVNLDDTAGVEDDGATAWATNVADAAITSATVTITGLFGASVGVAGKAGVSLDLDNSGTLAGNTAATTLDATTAVFTLTGANAATLEGLATGAGVWVTTDGTTQIEEMTATATVAVDWTDVLYTDSSSSGTFGALSKNGDSDPIDFLLTPGGAYSNYIRVSNKSSSAGDVFITIYSDDGDSETFDLGVISGQATTLAAQGSTSLINITDLYAAAQATDATFDVGTGKLRVVVSSEIADIEAQAVTISTDGKSFSTL